MRAQALAIALSTLAVVPAAHADFLVKAQDQASSISPGSDAPDLPDQAGPTRRLQVRLRLRQGPAVAQGFGNQVPLRFAVLQIVPKTVTVSYGPNVNPDQTVDWTGGQAWIVVLARTVAPLHLRVATTVQGVIIRK